MKTDLEQFIRDNENKFDNKKPDPAVLNRVLQQMQANAAPKPAGIVIPFRVVRWAAASLIFVACGITFWLLQKSPETMAVVKTKVTVAPPAKNTATDTLTPAPTTAVAENQTARRKSVDAVDRDLAARKQELVAKLKGEQEHSEKQVTFAGLKDMNSPASRITAASEASGLKNTGNDVVNVLVTTLNTDPNTNVRLAALDGLARFYREGYVRKKLVASLKKQQDPMVQIALINLLTRMKESGILTELDKIVSDENTQQSVKDCAYSGIIQLRSS